MDKALLDTDIFSEILKGKNPQVAKRATAYRETFTRYTISTITVMEIVKAFHKINREDKIRNSAKVTLGEKPTLTASDRESRG